MTRKKVTVAYISNNSERRASFKKRKKGLIKKVSELTTLCGVEACAIIYSQYDPEPAVWPSRLAAEAVLSRFSKLPEMEKRRRMVNQESLMQQRIKKAHDQLRRVQRENKRKDLEIFLFQCLAGKVSLDNFDLRDAAEMRWVITQTLRDINSRMEALQRDNQNQAASASASAAAEAAVAPPPPPVEVVAAPTGEENLESFPWNLVESPSGTGGGGVEGRGLGWDNGMVLPYPYIFDQANYSNASAAERRGPGAN